MEGQVSRAVAVDKAQGSDCGLSVVWAGEGAGDQAPNGTALSVEACRAVHFLDRELPSSGGGFDRADQRSAEDADKASERGVEKATAERAFERLDMLRGERGESPTLFLFLVAHEPCDARIP